MLDLGNTLGAVFNSSNPSGTPLGAALGMAGAAAGVTPYSTTGDLVGQSNAALAALVQQGQSPQQAAVAFFQTPLGQKLFSTGDGSVQKVIDNFQKLVTPPSPNVSNVPQGSVQSIIPAPGQPGAGVPVLGVNNPAATQVTFTGPGGQNITVPPGTPGVGAGGGTPGVPQVGSTNPTADIQSANSWLQKIGNIPKPDLNRMALDHLQSAEGKNRAFYDNLVKNGAISQDVADKLITGTMTLEKGLKPNGEPNGTYIMIDKSDPANLQHFVVPPPSIFTGPSGASAPAGPPGSVGPNGVLTPTGASLIKSALTPDQIVDDAKKNMFFGTGTIAGTSAYIGGLLRQVDFNLDPKGALAELSIRRTAIQNVHAAMTGLRLSQSGMGNNEGFVKQQQELLPDLTHDEDPLVALKKAQALIVNFKREIVAEQAVYNDRNAPKKLQDEAGDRITAYNRVLRTLPSSEDVSSMIDTIQTTGNHPNAFNLQNAWNAANTALSAGKKAVTGGPQPTTTPPGPDGAPVPAQNPPVTGTQPQGNSDALLAQIPNMTPQQLIALSHQNTPNNVALAVLGRLKQLQGAAQTKRK